MHLEINVFDVHVEYSCVDGLSSNNIYSLNGSLLKYNTNVFFSFNLITQFYMDLQQTATTTTTTTNT